MSIRRRTSTSIVDIWLTNNSNDVNVVGSLRWAVEQASSTLPTVIKVAPDFIDLAGVGRNMYVADTMVSNAFTGGAKDVTIDFSYINVIIGAGGGFKGAFNIAYPTFKLQNMVVENQDFGTVTSSLFTGMINYTNCRFENLVGDFTYGVFENNVTSNITNCIFKNVVNNSSQKKVFSFTSGTFTVDNCIFDNTYGVTGNDTASVNFSKCYINVSDTFIRYSGTNPTFNFAQCYIRNSGISTVIGLSTRNQVSFITNCTFVNMRISTSTGYGEKPSNIRHCTQIYTLPIGATTILNIMNTTFAHTIQNNIFISPNSNNIFPTNLTSLTESNNLYLCVNPNTVFPNSTHYPASTPITTLIDTNEQGVGETFKRYYLPTLTNNVARLVDVLQNQIEQDRNNPTNIGAI